MEIVQVCMGQHGDFSPSLSSILPEEDASKLFYCQNYHADGILNRVSLLEIVFGTSFWLELAERSSFHGSCMTCWIAYHSSAGPRMLIGDMSVCCCNKLARWWSLRSSSRCRDSVLKSNSQLVQESQVLASHSTTSDLPGKWPNWRLWEKSATEKGSNVLTAIEALP